MAEIKSLLEPIHKANDTFSPIQTANERFNPIQPIRDGFKPLQTENDAFEPLQTNNDAYNPLHRDRVHENMGAGLQIRPSGMGSEQFELPQIRSTMPSVFNREEHW